MTNLDEKGLPFTVRTVFIIDDKKTVRLSLQYPASTGRQFNEILRCIDSLQLTDKEKVATPQGWTPGDKVIVHNSLKTEDAKKHFEGKQVEEVVSQVLSFFLLQSGFGAMPSCMSFLRLRSTDPFSVMHSTRTSVSSSSKCLSVACLADKRKTVAVAFRGENCLETG